MKVARKDPGRNWDLVEIDNSLESLQKAVGGWIEAVTLAEDVAVICNEEGRILDLPYNCLFCGMDWYGTILLVGVDGEEFCDVPIDENEMWILRGEKQ